jgi:gliding motility-associated transport system permease protein
VNTILTTIKKELISYFFSPVAYVIAVLYYFWRGLEISRIVSVAVFDFWDQNDFTTSYVFTNSTNWMILLVPPILTMRCFAEEKRTGSLEVLMCAPVRDVEVVLGKWLAGLLFFAVLWLPTLPLLWILTTGHYLGGALPFGPVLSGYLGLFLLGSMLLAVGLFTSSFTDNQLLASLCAIIFNYALLQLPFLWEPAADSHYLVRLLYEQTNVFNHLSNWFGRGLVDSSQVMFYLGGTLFFLFLTVQSLGSRKWR